MKTFVPPANGYALRSLFNLRYTKLYSLRRVWAMLVTVLPRLVAELHAEFAESAKLEQAINANLRGLGYGG